jgi:hypothetical protein
LQATSQRLFDQVGKEVEEEDTNTTKIGLVKKAKTEVHFLCSKQNTTRKNHQKQQCKAQTKLRAKVDIE